MLQSRRHHWYMMTDGAALILHVHPPNPNPKKRLCNYYVIWRTLGIIYLTELLLKQLNGMCHCFILPPQFAKGNNNVRKYDTQIYSYKWRSPYIWRGQFALITSNNTHGITFYSRLGTPSMAESKREALSLEEFSVSFDRRDAITWLVKVVVSSVLLSGLSVAPSVVCMETFCCS